MNTKKLRAAAEAGDLDVIASVLDSDAGLDAEDFGEELDEAGISVDEEFVTAAYQWFLVAAHFGHKKAAQMAEDLLETSLGRYGDETIACAHYEVGTWYLTRAHGLPQDLKAAFEELEYAAKLDVRKLISLEAELERTRRKLTGKARERFDALFPAKTAKTKAKPPETRRKKRKKK